MSAGLNVRVNIIRELYTSNPYGGPTLLTGTTLYTDLSGRLDYFISREMITLAPGIEQSRSFTLMVRPVTIDVRVEDIIEIVFPPNHAEYLKKMRVRGIQRESTHPSDPRGFIELGLERIEPTRTDKF